MAAKDQPARAAPGVLGDLGELKDIAKLVTLAELALADRPRVGVGQRHEPVGDLLARDTLSDLTADLLGAVSQLVEAVGGGQLAPRAGAYQRANASALTRQRACRVMGKGRV